jgi:hypothetical protein
VQYSVLYISAGRREYAGNTRLYGPFVGRVERLRVRRGEKTPVKRLGRGPQWLQSTGHKL